MSLEKIINPTGIFSEKSKRERENYEQFLKFSTGASLEGTAVQEDRLSAGFEANQAVYGMFGKEGTTGGAYSSPITGGAAGAAGGAAGGGGIFDTTSERAQIDPVAANWLRRGGKPGQLAAEQTRKGILDPTGFAENVKGQIPFQILSRQVAEAQGLTDANSPFRQTLEQSIKNPIIEAGAENLRESMRYIQNQSAKGGSARRTALKEAQSMLATERSNRLVSQEMWQANLKFETWIRDYQKSTVNAAMAFTEGLGVNNYVNAMNNVSRFMVETTIPTTANYQAAAYQSAQQAKKGGLQEMIVGAAIAAIAGRFGGPAAGKAASDHVQGSQESQPLPQQQTGPRTLMGDIKQAGSSVYDNISGAGNYIFGGGGDTASTVPGTPNSNASFVGG